MSGADLHPEDLLDRVRRGQATATERARVDQHLASCDACRFEQAVLAESMRDGSPQSGDAARARAIERAALAALAERGLLAGKRRRRAGAWVAAIAVSSLATAAAAAVITQPPWLEQLIPQLASHEAPKPAKPKPKRALPVQAPQPAPEVVVPAPPPEAAVPPKVEPRAPVRRDARTAAELFAEANEARRERSVNEAVRLYRELERRHPSSPETAVSRVALGRLLLDRAADARGALRQFDAYLADPAQRGLREEALVGRALALGRLGREPEARAAWRMLLAEFPDSVNAERGRALVQPR
jgi:anti-sigma factor RsiW